MSDHNMCEKATKERRRRIRCELTGALKQIIYCIYDGKCAVCGYSNPRASESKSRGYRYSANGNEIHHIYPVHLGGISHIENLILLCPTHHREAHKGLINCDDYHISERDALFKIVHDPVEQKKIEEFLNFRYRIYGRDIIPPIGRRKAYEIIDLMTNEFMTVDVIWTSNRDEKPCQDYGYPEIQILPIAKCRQKEG